MHRQDLLRYGLWCGIVATADANRRHYHMSTTWLPHLVMNSLTLLLPDLCRSLPAEQETPAESQSIISDGLHVLQSTLTTLVRDNPAYVGYVLPFAAGYLTSHPRFNIYKGELGEKNLGGFGLDALPHGATALALTMLISDSAPVAAAAVSDDSQLAPMLDWVKQHPALASGIALALATAMWELGEYRIYKHEIGLRGNLENINMQWSLKDTVYDCITNAAGWALGSLLRQRK